MSNRLMEMTDDGYALVQQQQERDRIAHAEAIAEEQAFRKRQAEIREWLNTAEWDMRLLYAVRNFVAWLGWRNVYVWTANALKTLFLMGVFFLFHHLRGFVSREVYQRRLRVCEACDSLEMKTQRALWLGPRRVRLFCRGGASRGCGLCPDYRLSALSHKLRLANYWCPYTVDTKREANVPAPKFGRGGWFPGDDNKGV